MKRYIFLILVLMWGITSPAKADKLSTAGDIVSLCSDCVSLAKDLWPGVKKGGQKTKDLFYKIKGKIHNRHQGSTFHNPYRDYADDEELMEKLNR